MGLLLCVDDFERVRDKVKVFRRYEKKSRCDFCWKFAEYDIVLTKDEVSERNIGVYPIPEEKGPISLREIREFTLARDLTEEELKTCEGHLGSGHRVETEENNNLVVGIRCVTHGAIMMSNDSRELAGKPFGNK